MYAYRSNTFTHTKIDYTDIHTQIYLKSFLVHNSYDKLSFQNWTFQKKKKKLCS